MARRGPPIVAPGRRVMLIGGAGFIGHHLALSLNESACEPLVVDSLSVNHLNAPLDLDRPGINRDLYVTIATERLDRLAAAGIPVDRQDARDAPAIEALVRAFRPDAVVVLAAVAHASRSNADPHRAFENGAGTLEVALEAVRKSPGAHVVYLSSSMVYGSFATDTVDEDSPCDPMGIYGALKFGGEKLVRAYGRVYGIPYTIVRPAAAYGPGCIGRRFVQASIENALGGMPLQVVGDGSEAVDFTYVSDLVQGLLRVIGSESARNEVFNITTGRAASLNDVAAQVMHRFPGTTINVVPRDALVPRRGTLDITKARRMLGYEPRWSITTGVDSTIDWYLSLRATHPNLFAIEAPIVNE